MLMLIIYIAIAAYLVSKAERKVLATIYAFLTFVIGFIFFALIGYVLMEAGVIKFKAWYEDGAAFQRYQLARLILGSLQIAFSLYLLHLLIKSKGLIALITNKSKSFLSILKSIFPNESLWRLFIVFQAFGLIFIIYVDTTNSHGWDFIPDFLDYQNNFRFRWDMLRSSYWTRHHENWLALLCLLGPFITTKSIAWVRSAK